MYSDNQEIASMMNAELHCNVCSLIVESTSNQLCYDSRDWPKSRSSKNNFIDKMENTYGFITIHKIYKTQCHSLQQPLCHQQAIQLEMQQSDQQNWEQQWQQLEQQKRKQQWHQQETQQQKPQHQALKQQLQQQNQSQEQHILFEKVNFSIVIHEEEEKKENDNLSSDQHGKVKTNKHKWTKNDSQSAKSLACDLCHKKFTTSGYLKQHYNSKHSETKPFKCDFCGKSFSNETLYIKHITIHFSEKEYQCDKCNKQYAYRIDLKRHKYTHSDTKPYSCSQCNQSFIRSDHLIAHQRKHLHQKKKLQEVC